MTDAVDVLFIDEAGQMALADVISVAHAAKSLVLIGDPQQLERPLKGCHPDGAEKSALEHLLGEHKTILPEVGLLLPETWRLHPSICRFTSEVFYEGRLKSREALQGYVIQGHPWVKGAGLWYVPVEHQGKRNSSEEEVEAIAKIVGGLLQPRVKFSRGTESRALMTDDILIEDPIGESVTNPDGTGVRGKDAVGAFFDANIGPNQLTVTREATFPSSSPTEIAYILVLRTEFPNGFVASVRGVFTYKVNDDGLITNLRGYWNLDAMEFSEPDKKD